MRVLTLTADYPPRIWSGIGTAVASQARALSALGVEVHVLVAGQSEPAASLLGIAGPFVHALTRGSCPVDPAQFALVHLHSLVLSELAFEMRRRFHLPLIYTAHSLVHNEVREAQQGAFWCRAQLELLEHSDHVIFLSAAERTQAIMMVPDLVRRSSVIPNVVFPSLQPIRSPVGQRPIVFAGRFTQSKGVTVLAAIIRRLLATWRFQFVLAGGHGDQSGVRIITDVAAQFPQACRLMGWLDCEALDHLFAQAAVVLIPSLYEPFGMVALEAMRVGVPVLAAAVGGLPEIVRPGSGGRLVSSHDPEAWCSTIVETISDLRLNETLRRRGPPYVATQFNPARIANRLLEEVYRPSLGRS